MDKLLTAADIMARYQCTAPTARAYMRQMIHAEKPLRVTESALRQWETDRTRGPGEKAGPEKWPRGKNRGSRRIVTDYRIPRRRDVG